MERYSPQMTRNVQAQLQQASAEYLAVLVQVDDIRDFMRLTQPEEVDETLHVQATRDCRTDWYSFTVDGAGRIDHTTITQLPL